jgi:hypothetical protein
MDRPSPITSTNSPIYRLKEMGKIAPLVKWYIALSRSSPYVFPTVKQLLAYLCPFKPANNVHITL